jgi:hypothetical protein
MSFAGLEDAAATLDALAAGATPDRTRAIVGALALDALTWSTTSRDILDAAAWRLMRSLGQRQAATFSMQRPGSASSRPAARSILTHSAGAARGNSPMPSVSNARRRNEGNKNNGDQLLQ